MSVNLGRVGIWSMELRFGDKGEATEAAAEIEELGYGALWVPGGLDGGVLEDIAPLLAGTRKMALATGILNVWRHEPADVAAWFAARPAGQQQRLMLGLGISHGPIIGEAWGKPVAVMRDWIGRLLAAGQPADQLCVAALGPKMLELSRDLTAGAHPYLVTPEHTVRARAVLGAGKLLAPEQGVVLEADPARARELARGALAMYAQLPNYTNNWRRLGFSEDDIATMSDKLIDGLFAWGSAAQIAERVKAHHDAGADHVCIQVINSRPDEGIAGYRAQARELAAALV